MDAFLTKLSHHATSYAIRSCLALSSTFIIQQGSRLLKSVQDDPLKVELAMLHRRLARKIELVSPILESIEFRYTRGNAALEAVVQTSRELREDIDALAKKLEEAAIFEEETAQTGHAPSAKQLHADMVAILSQMKYVIVSIDDAIPLINLWVSAIGGIQTQQSAFSPARLLQASMLLNVGDTQYVLNPGRSMQIGPDFMLSLYMLFRGHASPQEGEPYGIEEGQRKPTWQEVIHKARVRLYRSPPRRQFADEVTPGYAYSYQLQIVEDLDDGRVHTLENGNIEPTLYDGVRLAGIKEMIPVGQISKMFYADVGRILNITNDDGVSSNPVLLLKRDVQQTTPQTETSPTSAEGAVLGSIEEGPEDVAPDSEEELDPQDVIDRQIREESQVKEWPEDESTVIQPTTRSKLEGAAKTQWTIPPNLDPEWMALEVFELDEDDSSTADDESSTQEAAGHQPYQRTSHTPIDGNLINQLHRMSIASPSSVPMTSRPNSSHSQQSQAGPAVSSSQQSLAHYHGHPPPPPPFDSTEPAAPTTPHQNQLSPTAMERSPFGAIRTSLSLLEMLLRLASLQEFEQTTHLAIPDHVLKFYLDESASESGLHGKERWAARAEAARKMGFDPYTDAPVGEGEGV
ncbi:Ran-specific GTPase-activating 30 [Apiospora marii]|uniref:Ran-specific GTPase-activating 30 n=1 Tax=Apiospora marii TaxID=335849 RepID=A0ABR1RH46_9PEZI